MATVVELISTMLKREGVQYLFGIPGGGGTIDLLDATASTPPSSMRFASCDPQP